MATVRDPGPPFIVPGMPNQNEKERVSEEYTHLQQDRLAHEEPSFGETLQYLVISVIIVGSVVGAAVLYLVTH